jgi:hypothetical protein
MEVTRYLVHRHPPTLRQEENFVESAAEDPHRVLWAIVLGEILREEWDARQEKTS